MQETDQSPYYTNKCYGTEQEESLPPEFRMGLYNSHAPFPRRCQDCNFNFARFPPGCVRFPAQEDLYHFKLL